MLRFEIRNISQFSEDELTNCFLHMDQEKQKRIMKYKNADAQKCSIAAECLSKQLLSEHTGISPNEIRILTDDNGKPFTPDLHGVFFNISHSKNMIAAAVSDKQVGIDIEKLRILPLKAARKMCCEEELCYIFGKDIAGIDFNKDADLDTIKRFLQIWTAKEAYFKCIGTGIKSPKEYNALKSDITLTKLEQNGCIICIATK